MKFVKDFKFNESKKTKVCSFERFDNVFFSKVGDVFISKPSIKRRKV
jgi:hypothetical protein